MKKRYHIIWMLLLWQGLFAAKVDTVSVHSMSMNKEIKAVIILPDAYARQQKNFPVIYLLHGYSDKYSAWSNKMDLKPLADTYNFILVCPDGGYNSWYLDSPLDSSSRYETHIAVEVTNFLKKHYRADSSRCAITGLSMGGHGALYLAARHPHIFSAAGSLSGGVDLMYSTKRWEIAEKIGSYEKYPRRWHNHSVIHIIDQLKKAKIPLFIDCGIDDFFIGINRTLHRKLLKAGVAHEYIERPGGHSWAYWTNALEYHLLFFRKSFFRSVAR